MMDTSGPDSLDELPDDLGDEITSINAIYGPGTLTVRSPATASSSSFTTLLLTAPASHPLHHTKLLVSFPSTYPQAPARILGPATTDSALGKGGGHAAAEQAQCVLEAVSVAGEPVIFALLAELETQQQTEFESSHSGSESSSLPPPPPPPAKDPRSPPPDLDRSIHAPPPGHDPRFALASWTTAAAPLESHKSVFIGRAIAVSSAADVAAATAALLAQDRHVARATHNIRAWRFRVQAAPSAANGAMARSIEHQESDDDGESRAGAKVLEVLAAMGAWDVLVVVSRWYGGVKLGPERFRLIGQCARDVLVLGGWGARTEEKKQKKKGK